jgi:hypothetical protein
MLGMMELKFALELTNRSFHEEQIRKGYSVLQSITQDDVVHITYGRINTLDQFLVTYQGSGRQIFLNCEILTLP